MDKPCFGVALGCAERFLEAGVSGQWLELLELAEVSDPLVADRFRDCARQFRIRFQQPATRRYSVRLIVETLGKHFGKIFDRRRPQQLGMNSGDTIGAVRADTREVSHANLARAA